MVKLWMVVHNLCQQSKDDIVINKTLLFVNINKYSCNAGEEYLIGFNLMFITLILISCLIHCLLRNLLQKLHVFITAANNGRPPTLHT